MGRRGQSGWTFDELLPLFCAVESDQDFRDEWHGSDGPIPVARLRPDELDERSLAFVASATACGHAVCDDHNRPRAVGVGPWPRNVRDGLRMSTALTYLAAARARPNLEIRADTVGSRSSMVGQVGASAGRRRRRGRHGGARRRHLRQSDDPAAQRDRAGRAPDGVPRP